MAFSQSDRMRLDTKLKPKNRGVQIFFLINLSINQLIMCSIRIQAHCEQNTSSFQLENLNSNRPGVGLNQPALFSYGYFSIKKGFGDPKYRDFS